MKLFFCLFKTALSIFLMIVSIFLIYQSLPSSSVDALISRTNLFKSNHPLNHEQKAFLTKEMGLEAPLSERLFLFLNRLSKGDLGSSLFSSRPVTSWIQERVPTTFLLAILSIVFSLLIGTLAGFWMAYHQRVFRNSRADWATNFFLCLPPFALGSLIFSYSPIESPHVFVVSICVLAIFPYLAFQIRDRLQELQNAPFSQTAISKGLSWIQIYQKHLLVACVPTLLAFLPLGWSLFFGTSVLVEPLFGVSGLGSLTIESLRNQDIPVLLGITLLVGVIRLFLAGLRDLLFVWKFQSFLQNGEK